MYIYILYTYVCGPWSLDVQIYYDMPLHRILSMAGMGHL